MSNENCSIDSGKDLNHFLRDLNWLHNGDPEGNRALLEGLYSGYNGYVEDKIIRPARAARAEPKRQNSGAVRTQGPTSLTPHCPDYPFDPDEVKVEILELVLYENAMRKYIEDRDASRPPPRKITRPTIGEERKAWMLEARKAVGLIERQGKYPEAAASRDENYSSLSQPRIVTNSNPDTSSEGVGMSTVTDSESCTYLFQQSEENMRPSNIRLSPRMEKLDKLIPTASKEFLNTLRIVNTQSEKQILVQTPTSDASLRSDDVSNVKESQGSNNESCQSKRSETETGSKCNVTSSGGGRSYKEVFLYGPNSTTTAVIDEPPECRRSCCRFPSLPKLKQSSESMGGGESKSSSTPLLWSSVLQGRPNSSPYEMSTMVDLKLRKLQIAAASSGDSARTSKYSSENPIDLFGRKSAPPALPSAEKAGNCVQMETPVMIPRGELLKRDEREYQTDQESKSDSESISTVDDASKVTRRASGMWIAAKTKGRKKKSVKSVD